MIDTVSYQILFKMNNHEDAENVSKQIGTFTRKNKSYNNKGSSYSFEGKELLSAQDILNIDNKEIIILVSGFKAKPIKIKAIYFFNDKKFKKSINWSYDPSNEFAKKHLFDRALYSQGSESASASRENSRESVGKNSHNANSGNLDTANNINNTNSVVNTERNPDSIKLTQAISEAEKRMEIDRKEADSLRRQHAIEQNIMKLQKQKEQALEGFKEELELDNIKPQK